MRYADFLNKLCLLDGDYEGPQQMPQNNALKEKLILLWVADPLTMPPFIIPFSLLRLGNLTSMMTQGRIQPDEMCVGAMYKQFRQVQLSTSLCELANIFDRYCVLL
jgi:hypothetical protein